MKAVKKISLVLALIIGVGLFLLIFIQFPTTNMFRIFGQLAGSFIVGVVVYWITYGIGSLVIRVKQ
ncbi:hypothetical protein ACFLTT_00160 [Chloroflexota bacterium]